MFGGMDPTALLKRKPPAEGKTEKTGDEKPKEKPGKNYHKGLYIPEKKSMLCGRDNI